MGFPINLHLERLTSKKMTVFCAKYLVLLRVRKTKLMLSEKIAHSLPQLTATTITCPLKVELPVLLEASGMPANPDKFQPCSVMPTTSQ